MWVTGIVSLRMKHGEQGRQGCLVRMRNRREQGQQGGYLKCGWIEVKGQGGCLDEFLSAERHTHAKAGERWQVTARVAPPHKTTFLFQQKKGS